MKHLRSWYAAVRPGLALLLFAALLGSCWLLAAQTQAASPGSVGGVSAVCLFQLAAQAEPLWGGHISPSALPAGLVGSRGSSRLPPGAGSVPGALPTPWGARWIPWVLHPLEGTPRSPRALGWGWGSEKPDKNQVRVTFQLELCPRGPQPLSTARMGLCGGDLCAKHRCCSELLLGHDAWASCQGGDAGPGGQNGHARYRSGSAACRH